MGGFRSIPACAGEPHRLRTLRAAGGVYPRVCGGTLPAGETPPTAPGLSPRVRGNPGKRKNGARAQRSIPACAGEPVRGKSASLAITVYPRVCGGTMGMLTGRAGDMGLSPRVRGNHMDRPLAADCLRSIPACAGEPGWSQEGPEPLRVYPRVCGGTRPTPPPSKLAQGLSPRVRGNPLLAALACADGGSIPACAGEPSRSVTTATILGVYPRVCGGTRAEPKVGPRESGLSPRVRGNPPTSPPPGRPARSIPACAGEPVYRVCPVLSTTVYPRVCGGTAPCTRDTGGGPGLSPRVRGNPAGTDDAFHAGGSIPACAGEPGNAGAGPFWKAVYPRVCGGTLMLLTKIRRGRGLSPRVRGNPGRVRLRQPSVGSIPACAGEPAPRTPRSSWIRVYPRVCGGTQGHGHQLQSRLGLSPRVRGNPPPRAARAPPPGSIPACAGEP